MVSVAGMMGFLLGLFGVCLESIDRYRSLFLYIRLFHTDMRVLLPSTSYAIRMYYSMGILWQIYQLQQ